MRLAFLGTPDFAVPTLAALVEAGHEVACVYSQPPALAGRGRALRPSAVQAFAEGLGLAVRTPTRLKSRVALAEFRALDLDAAVVTAFGQILSQAVLDAPRLGCFNLHASLLPRWRGAAPIQRAIMAGDATTGVAVMRMSAGLDEGPVLETAATPIEPDDTAGSLHDRLAALGAPLMVEALARVERGEARETPQPSEGVTYARKLDSAEARLDWNRPAPEVDRHIRGLSPFPGAWFAAPSARGSVRIKALMSCAEAGRGATPGEVLDANLLIACNPGAVRLTRLQREGRGPQEAAEFLRGFALPAGQRL